MPLPLLALPIAMGAASAAGAIGQASAAKQQARAMMPDAYRRRLQELENANATGGLGLRDAERQQMEAQGVSSRAGLVAQQQAAQLQRASQASGAALSGRDLFAQELAMQQSLSEQATREADAINRADMEARELQRQQMMELQQRQADSEAARKMANRQLIGDLAGAALTGAVGAYGASQMAGGYDQMVGAVAGSTRMRDAQADIFRGQMAMQMAGAYGGGAPTMPAAPAMLTAPAAPTMPTAPPIDQQLPGVTGAMRRRGRVIGYQRGPNGETLPVYGGY
jgi:hypothetical protein